ncbi:MAG: 4Fe-4S binding protein [Verrucomicrobiota bacterium]
MSSGLSRRDLFSLLGRPLRSVVDTSKALAGGGVGKASSRAPAVEAQAKVAIIQGRFCLAYTSFCTVCSERCPVPSAMKVEKGIPMVIADVCTGCGICHDVCPAPTNAVLVIPRRRNPRFPSPPAA